MPNAPKKLGRPLDSGLNDSKALNAMADMMLSNPKLKPTTAVKKILTEPGPSLIHRLRRKWKADSGGLLSKARIRKERHVEEQKRQVYEAIANNVDRTVRGRLYGNALSAATGSLTGPYLEMLVEQQKAARLAQGSLASMAGSILDQDALSQIRMAIDSPALKAIREMDKTQKQIREALGLSLIGRF